MLIEDPLFFALNIHFNHFRLNSPILPPDKCAWRRQLGMNKTKPRYGRAERERFMSMFRWISGIVRGNQTDSSLATSSPETCWAAACLCIRLWFTSALCDHLNIQLILTTEAGSGHIEQIHI